MRASGFIGLALLTVFQVTWFRQFHLDGVSPDVPLVMISALALLLGWRPILFWVAIFIGLLLDILGGMSLGVSAIALVTVVIFLGWWREVIVYRGLAIFVFAAANATVIYDGVLFLFLLSQHEVISIIGTLRTIILPSAVLNCIIAIPLSFFAQWVSSLPMRDSS